MRLAFSRIRPCVRSIPLKPNSILLTHNAQYSSSSSHHDDGDDKSKVHFRRLVSQNTSTSTSTSIPSPRGQPALPAQISQLDELMKGKETDKCIQYLITTSTKYRYKFKDEQLGRLVKLMLTEDRLEEAWHIIKRCTRWNKTLGEMVIYYLGDSNQHYFILPFAHCLYLESNKTINLNKFAWNQIIYQRKQTFNEKDDDWWLLTDALVQLYDNKYSKSKILGRRLASIMQSWLHFKTGIPDHVFNQGPLSKSQAEIMRSIIDLYLWNLKNPIFNINLNFDVSFNKERIRLIFNLFNPQIESNETVKELKLLLASNQIERATSKLLNAITTTTGPNSDPEKLAFSKYYVFPFIEKFSDEQNLIKLVDLITSIESTTPLHIKFTALSEYTVKLLRDLEYFIDSSKDPYFAKQNFLVVVRYLLQETSLNVSIWNRSTLTFLGYVFKTKIKTDMTVSLSMLKRAVKELETCK